MKKVTLCLITIATMASCKNKSETIPEETRGESSSSISDDVLESAVIYEANIRQYSPEGTFNAFTKDIPKLKDLGVKIIWMKVVFTITIKNTKATVRGFVSHIKDEEERAKELGSYYAIAN